MKRKWFTFCAAALSALCGWAAVPAQSQVTEVAQTLVEQSLQAILPDRTIKTAEWVALEDGLGVWAVQLAPTGHLVLANSTKYRPLLAFSEHDFVAPEKDTPHYTSLLAAAQRVAAAEAAAGEEAAAWYPTGASLLATATDPSTEGGTISAQPIDTAAWYQKKVLAWYVPGNAPCGCVATAQAQGMHGLQWPVYPETTFEANLTYWPTANAAEADRISEAYRFNPYSKFDYAKMATDYGSPWDETVGLIGNTADNNQIARLVLLNDILSNMVFKDGGASTTTVPPAVITPWMTAPNMRTRADVNAEFTEADKSAIQAAMMAGYPVVCNTNSHAILASGYATIKDAETGNDVPYVRLNYGYANSDTKWYSIDDSIVLTFAITAPTKAVQCDPLPAISTTSPTVSWHIPKCYAGGYTNEVTSFSVKAIPVSETTTWSLSNFTTDGYGAGNTNILQLTENTLQVSLTTATDDTRVYYTLDTLFVPTASTEWTTTYSAEYPSTNGVELQVLPLGGAWQTVGTAATSHTTSATATVSLADYEGKPCKLRYFINNSVSLSTASFATTAISVTNTQVADKNTTAVTPVEVEKDKRNYPFSNLTAGNYAFSVTPVFGKENGATDYCYATITDDANAVETFAEFEVTSPSATLDGMQIVDGFFRYCTYEGTSYIRVNAGEKVTKLDVYSSHLTAFPDSLFTVTEHGNGIFDIVVNKDGNTITSTPNDRVNLSLVATTDAGTISSHELSLAFTTDEKLAVAESEPAAPTPGEDPIEPETPAVELPDPVYTNTLGGDSLLFVDGTAYTATKFTELADLGENGTDGSTGNFDDVITNGTHTDTHTISMWVKVDTLANDTLLWWASSTNARNSGQNGYAVRAMANGGIRVGKTSWNSETASPGWYSGQYMTSNGGFLTAGEWAYVTVVLTKPENEKKINPQVYVNGTSVGFGDGTFEGNLNGDGGEATFVQIGENVTAAGITVYDAALTAEQVAAIDRTANLAIVVEPEPTVTSSFGVNFMTANDQEINSAAGYTVDGYEAPSTWGNFIGSANGTGDVSSYKVNWTAHGTWNSTCDKDTDNKKLLYGYLDDVVNSGRTKATVTITGLPDDKQYAVALILSGDGNNTSDYNNRYSPVLINGETYSYKTENDVVTLVTGDAAVAATTWGNRGKNASANGELVAGTNVMFVEGISGSILSITSAMDQWNVSRLTIAGVQVWITDADAVVPAAPEDKETISLNFGSEKGSVGDALAGLRNVGAWNDLTTDSGSGGSLRAWNGNATIEVPINYSFESSTIYQWTTATDAFLKGYLDDGSHDSVTGATITMSEIPFETYSVIVYCATDTENAFFRPVQINGVWYAGSASARGVGYALPVLDVETDAITWGASQNTTAAYGTNAIRVDGLSGNLSIQGLGKAGTNNKHRGGIAAIQIVNTGDAVVIETPTWTPTAENQNWSDMTLWSHTQAVPTSGNVIIDTSALTADISVTVPSEFSALQVLGPSTAVTTVLFGDKEATAISVSGRVAFAHATLLASAVTAVDDAWVIDIVDSDVTWATNVTDLYNFAKKGSGTLTLTAGLINSKKLHVLEGTLKFNGQPNGNYSANITIDAGATLAIDNKGNYNPVCGSGTIVNNGTFSYSGTGDGHLPATVSGSGKIAVNGGTLTLVQANTHTGGTEIAADARVILGGSTVLPAGSLMGSGIAEINATADLPAHAIVSADWTGTVELLNSLTLGSTLANLGNEKSLVKIFGTIADDEVTVPANIAIGGSGTISGALTLSDGATLDATQGTLEVTGNVTATGASINATAYGPVLTTTGTLTVSNCTTTLADAIVVATETQLCVIQRPSLKEDDVETVSDEAATVIANEAAEKGYYTVSMDETSAPADGLALFENVALTFTEDGTDKTKATAKVSYAFGIKTITVDTTNGKVTVTAKVDKLSEGDATPTFADGVTVELYSGSDLIGTAPVTKGASVVDITSTGSVLGDLGDAASATNAFTIKATNEQNAQ